MNESTMEMLAPLSSTKISTVPICQHRQDCTQRITGTRLEVVPWRNMSVSLLHQGGMCPHTGQIAKDLGKEGYPHRETLPTRPLMPKRITIVTMKWRVS